MCEALEGLGLYWDPGSIPLSTAGYLPRPTAQLYQFQHVKPQGQVCGQSPPSQFQEPKPMAELMTLGETDGDTDILPVIPKASVLLMTTEQQSCSWARKWEGTWQGSLLNLPSAQLCSQLRTSLGVTH